MANKNHDSKSSYNKLIAKQRSWKPLAVITVLILGGSLAISVYATNPASFAIPSPDPNCQYAIDGQTHNCNSSPSPSPSLSVASQSPTPTASPSQSLLSVTPSPLQVSAQSIQSSLAEQIEPDQNAENIMYIRLKAERAKKGVRDILRSPCLDSKAREWALKMAQTKILANGDAIANAQRDCGSTYWTGFGEIVGSSVGYTDLAVNKLFDSYVTSPTHQKTMLDQRYLLVGIGAYHVVNGNMYLDQIFISCQNNSCEPPVTTSSY